MTIGVRGARRGENERLFVRPLAAALLVFAGSAALPGQTITEYPLARGSNPAGIASGTDGNVWFVEEHGDRVGRITPSGTIKEFPLPIAGSFARGIAAGPDGSLWFTELPGRIGRVTVAGGISELTIPVRPAEPISIVTGPDRNLWFTDFYDRISRMTTAGTVTSFPLAANSAPRGIVSGPDGNLWFAESGRGKIGRITTAGDLVEFALPDSSSSPFAIALGSDGNLWFTEAQAPRIGRITPAGLLTEFPLPAGSGTYGITAGSDGNIWFTESTANRIARITPSGAVTELDVPTLGSTPTEIVSGPDGSLWFTEFNGDRIGRVEIGFGCAPDGNTLCLNAARFEVKVAWSAPSLGTSGVGEAVPLTVDTGAFWFFSANNIELVVKVVDGRPANGRFWVFGGSLSDVAYTVTVRDRDTGALKTYSHASGTLASFADTAAFP